MARKIKISKKPAHRMVTRRVAAFGNAAGLTIDSTRNLINAFIDLEVNPQLEAMIALSQSPRRLIRRVSVHNLNRAPNFVGQRRNSAPAIGPLSFSTIPAQVPAPAPTTASASAPTPAPALAPAAQFNRAQILDALGMPQLLYLDDSDVDDVVDAPPSVEQVSDVFDSTQHMDIDASIEQTNNFVNVADIGSDNNGVQNTEQMEIEEEKIVGNGNQQNDNVSTVESAENVLDDVNMEVNGEQNTDEPTLQGNESVVVEDYMETVANGEQNTDNNENEQNTNAPVVESVENIVTKADMEVGADGGRNANDKENSQLDQIRRAFIPFKIRGRRPSKDFRSDFSPIFERPLGPRNSINTNDFNRYTEADDSD